MLLRIVIFLIINFGALAIGGLFSGQGAASEWYATLNKAPWTPPGWVFGFTWTTIMICFSIYLAFLWKEIRNKKFLMLLFTMQWILNVSWNPTFFHFHQVLAGLIIISVLLVLVGYFLFYYWKELSLKSLLIVPYLTWLIIATSLNAYIFLMN